MLLEKEDGGYAGLIRIITKNKKKDFIEPIPLRIEQRRFSAAQCPKIDNEKPADSAKLFSLKCSVCNGPIEGNLFQCFQCEGDYNMCGFCVTSGKHSENIIIIRATDTKVPYISIIILLK